MAHFAYQIYFPDHKDGTDVCSRITGSAVVKKEAVLSGSGNYIRYLVITHSKRRKDWEYLEKSNSFTSKFLSVQANSMHNLTISSGKGYTYKVGDFFKIKRTKLQYIAKLLEVREDYLLVGRMYRPSDLPDGISQSKMEDTRLYASNHSTLYTTPSWQAS